MNKIPQTIIHASRQGSIKFALPTGQEEGLQHLVPSSANVKRFHAASNEQGVQGWSVDKKCFPRQVN